MTKALDRLRTQGSTVDDLRELIPKLLAVVDAAERYSYVRVAGCLCCNPDACDVCPPCPKCELDAALVAVGVKVSNPQTDAALVEDIAHLPR
jgi:hypothetical protein